VCVCQGGVVGASAKDLTPLQAEGKSALGAAVDFSFFFVFLFRRRGNFNRPFVYLSSAEVAV
jgi:hypothetical protein